jgi:hypothetical protein
MQMIQTEVSKTVTMSSLELVDFINSQRKEGEAELQHKHFLDKVPLVLGEGYAEFSATYQHPQNKQIYPMFRFPKREACLMAMSYSYDLQAKVFDRMTELEAQQAPAALIDLSNPSQVLKFALDLIERNRQEEEVRESLRLTEKRLQIPQPLGDRGVMVLGSTCFVPLNEEFRAIVDRSDLGRVLDHTWRVNLSDAVCKVEREDIDLGKRKRDTLQEFIYQYQGKSNGFKVTHANHNGLDNRVENLVLLTRAQIRARDDLFFGRFIQPSLKTNGVPTIKDNHLVPILHGVYSRLEQEIIFSLQSNL